MPIDRLSELPDCLIIHILSLLEVKQAAITALLSKRWECLWTKTPRLVFKEESSWHNKIRDFVTRVNRTLLTCGVRNGRLETLEVDFPYNECFSVDVNVWVGFSVKNNVEQVSLLFNKLSPSSSDDFYYVPRTMLHNSYLKLLTLRGCRLVAPRGTIEWSSLTELNIEHAEVQQHVIDKIMSGCPVLRYLDLDSCWGFSRLEVGSKKLYKLLVYDPEDGVDDEPLLEISAPYLHELMVSMECAKGRKLHLGNISSLVRATIDIYGYDWDHDSEELMNMVKELHEKFRHVKVFEPMFGYNEVLSRVAISGYRFPQSARTSLLLDIQTNKESIHGILGLLESSPNLESLVIDGFVSDAEEHSICPDPKCDLDCDLFQLKTITIKDFIDPNLAGEPMLTLARILLKRAPALEKMVVSNDEVDSCSSVLSLNERLKISQTLLSYPRSTKEAPVFLQPTTVSLN